MRMSKAPNGIKGGQGYKINLAERRKSKWKFNILQTEKGTRKM